MEQSATDLETVKNEIRLTAERRESQNTWAAKTAAETLQLVRAGNTQELTREGLAGLDDFARTVFKLKSTPETFDSSRSWYHISDLLRCDDAEFIWNAYKAVLKREPDETGLRGLLEKLRAGQRTKIEILSIIRYSAEGRRTGVRVDGLRGRSQLRKMMRVAKSLWSTRHHQDE